MNNLRLGKNLTSLLEASGMTAAQVSRKAPCRKQLLSDWQAAREPRDLESLRRVCAVFSTHFGTTVTLDAMLFDDDILATLKENNETGELGDFLDGSGWLNGTFDIKIRRRTKTRPGR